MDEYNLVMMSQGVTYARPHQAGSALDVALVSASLVGECSWTGYTDSLGSDHIPGILDLGLTQRVEPTSRVDWGRFRGAMDNAMKGESGLAGAGVRDLEDAVGNFVSQTQLAVKCSTVRVTPRSREHVPYWSVACQKMTNARKGAFRRWQCLRSPESYLAYKLANAQCRRFLREARRLQLEKLCRSLNEHCSPRLAWALVRGLAGMGSVSCVDSSHLFMDHGATIALRMAEQHFTLLYTSQSGLSAADFSFPAVGREEPSPLGGPFLMSELASALYRRKATSPGLDGITYTWLKSFPIAAKYHLLQLFNASWARGLVPSMWKQGKIVLLPKPGKDLSVLAGWRPICLLSCLIKVFEAMINQRLLWWLEKHGTLADAQNGFRWRRSTHDCLHSLSSRIRHAFEAQRSVGVLHMDIAGAYDSVDTHLLLSEMHDLGLPAAVCRWFQSYLSDRSVVVRVGHKLTSAIPMHRGLPQGSVLSPTLWNIYGARLIRQTKAKLPRLRLVNFAEDFQLITDRLCPYETVQGMEDSGGVFISVCQDNYLTVSRPKCIPMLHTQRHHKPFTMELQGETLDIPSSTRVLGVRFDTLLTGAAHVQFVRDKLDKRHNVLRALTGVMRGLNTQRMLSLYRSYIRPVLDYGASVFVHMAPSMRAKLEVEENKGLRLVLGTLPATPNVALHAEAFEVPLLHRWKSILTRVLGNQRHCGREI